MKTANVELTREEIIELRKWENRTVSSDAIICPHCAKQINDPADYVDIENGESDFHCPFCQKLIYVEVKVSFESKKPHFEFRDRVLVARREKQLYQRRMAGDWS